MAGGKSGAPKGNRNNSKGRAWYHALQWQLANYTSDTIAQGQALRAIAKKCVEQALEGDKDARAEIANRLDGKPVQQIEHSGSVNDRDLRELTRAELLAIASGVRDTDAGSGSDEAAPVHTVQ